MQPIPDAPGPPPALPPTPPPTASSLPNKPFPYHFIVGCLGLGVLMLSCVGFGTAVYFYNAASDHDSEAVYSSMSDSDGEGFMADIYRQEAEDERHYSIGSGCCGSTLCLLSFGGFGGAVVMARRRPKTT